MGAGADEIRGHRLRLLATPRRAGCYRSTSVGRDVTAGFWFEPVSYESRVLGGSLTAADLDAIASRGARGTGDRV